MNDPGYEHLAYVKVLFQAVEALGKRLDGKLQPCKAISLE